VGGHHRRTRRQPREDRHAADTRWRRRIELFEYLHPDAIETDRTLPNEIGMHRVAFSDDDLDQALAIAAQHGCHPLRGVADYQGVYRLTYLRGPSGIIVMLAEDLTRK